MKKFTIFLLTFLLFVGFNQLNAQEYGDDGGPQRAADLISPMFQSGLRCTNDASIVLRAVFTVTASTGSYNLLSSPLIYLSDDGITFDPPIIPDFATPDNAYFYSDITVMKGQTKYLYATIVEFMGGTSYVTLTSIVATLTVVDPPTVTISPDPLVGVMCEGGSVELNGKVAWTISEAEFTNITYSWLLDGAVKETGMYSNYNNPPPPHPIGDIKTYNFEDLAVGQREFTFGVVVTDSLGRYSVGRSCDVDTTISIIVVNQPEVTLEQPPLTPPICENADELTLIATNDAPFTQVLDDFNGVGIFDAVYSLYIDDSTTPFEEHTFSVLAGNAIPQYTFTVPVKGFLEPCEHTFKVTLAIINTDISANLDAFCLGEGELEIIIWQLPLITLNKDTVEVCSGEPIAIIATASNEECGSDEFWHPFNWIPLTIGGELGTVTPNPVPDDLLTTTTSTYNNMIEPSYHTTVSEFIYVTVVDGNGCVSLLDSALIIVHPLPELVAVFDEDVCLNDDPFLLGPGYPIDDMGVQIPVCATCIEVYAGPGVEAMTNDDDEIIGYIFDPAKAGVGIHEITYTFTDEFGCTNSETFDIEVRDLPEATFEYLGAPEEFCAVGTYLPTITIISNDAMLTNQRFDIIPDDKGAIIDALTGELDLYNAEPGAYQIVFYFQDEDEICWNTDTLDIYVHPLPKLDSIILDIIPCVGEMAMLTAYYTLPEGYEDKTVSFQWHNITDDIALGTEQKQTILGSDYDIEYRVVVTIDETGCTDTLTKIVEATENPVLQVNIEDLSGELCNYSYVNLDASVVLNPDIPNTTQTYKWEMCEYDLAFTLLGCKDIPLDQLIGTYKIEVDDNFQGYVQFHLIVNTDGYNCPIETWSNFIMIKPSIKVECVGSCIDTVCHGGSAQIAYKISNFNLDLANYPVYYRWLENELYLEGADQIHMLHAGVNVVSFTSYPELHTNENGPESYCYQLEIWQGDFAAATNPLDPSYCHTLSECHMVTVLKDPVLLLTCPTTIVKNLEGNHVFTANLSGGYGEPYYYWYVQTVLVQEGPENTYELDDISILGTLGTYRVDVKATQPYSGCDAEIVTCWFDVVCPPMTVEIKGPNQACVGEVVMLIADVVTDAEYTVQWKKDGIYLVNVPEYSVVNNNLIFTVGEEIDLETYILEVSNCDCEIKTAQHQLQVIPKTVIWVNNYTICENGAVEVTVNKATFGGNEIYRYLWYDVEGEIIDITYDNKRIFNFSEMIDNVTYFSVKTEMLNAVCSSNVAEFSITVIGKLEAVTLLASDTIICVNNTVLFTLGADENIEEFGIPVYTWWVDGFATDAPSLDFLNLSFTSLGMHYVNVQITYPDNICEFVTNDIYIEVRELIGVEISGVNEVCMQEGVPEYLTAFVEPYNAPDIKYQWYENGTMIIGGNGQTQAINPVPGTYTYMVIATDTLSGCEVQLQPPYTVIVDKSPVIQGITALTKTICLGDQIEFSHIPPINNVTYTWYIDGVAQENATLNIFTYLFNEQGTFVIKLKATSNVLGCESDLVTLGTITVKAPPTVELEGPGLVCNADEQAVLQAVVFPEGNYNYQWFLNGDPIDGGTGATQQITNIPHSVPYVYWVVVTDDDSGCEVKSNNKSVLVEQLLTTGISADFTEICRGASVNLTANVSGDNNFNLQWYATLGTQTYPIDGAISPNLQVTPDQTMTYHFVATQIGSECTSVSNPITITVIQKPDAPVLTVTPALVCSGDQITISTTASGMITWYKNDFAQPFSGPTPFNSITDQPVATHSLTTYSYYATVTTVGSTVSCVSDISAPVTVVVHPEMNWVIDGPENVCTQAVGGAHAILNAIPFGEFETQVGTQYEMTWSYLQGGNPEVIILGPPNQLPYVQIPNNLPVNDPAAPYTFILKVKAIGYNCHYTAYHTMHILPQPTVAITVDNPNICIAGTVVATAHPTPASTIYTYVWKLNGNVVPGNTAQMTFTGDFNYGINEITVDIQREFANAACSATFTKTFNVLTQPFIEVAQTIMGLELPGMCVGGIVDLNAQILDFDVTQILPNVFTYDWYLYNNPYATQGNELSKVFNTPGTYIFKVQAKTAANIGCFTDYATSTVNVVKQPEVSIYPKDYNLHEVCPGATIELIAVLDLVDPTIQKGEKYKWNITDWLPFTNQIDPLSVIINYTGEKSFFLKAEFENPTCNAATSNTVSFTIANAPKWELSIAPQPYFGSCTGEPIELKAKIKGGVEGENGATIQWWYSLNGAPYQKILGQAGGEIIFIPVQDGSYTFKAVYTHLNPLSGCSIPEEDGILGPIEVGLTITPKAVFVTDGDTRICTNNPSAEPVKLPIHFTGTPPFNVLITWEGGQKWITNIMDNPYIFEVNPAKTTTYTIVDLTENTVCKTGNFIQNSVTVRVIDVIVNAPTFETCDGQNEITVLVNSDELSSNFATVVFPNGNTQYVPIVPTGVGSTNKFIIDIPQGIPFGVYDVRIIIDGCEFVVTIVYNHNGTGSNLIHRRWEGVNEVLVVSNNSEQNSEFYNGGYNFTSYQWYKNGDLIPGATQQWYQDPKGINGKYHVKLGGYRISDNTPIEFSTCSMDFTNTSAINVFPVPAGVGEPVYVEIDLTVEELNNAYMDIYDAKGAFIHQVKVVSRLTKVDGFKAQGSYFGKITTGTNEIKSVRFLIVK